MSAGVIYSLAMFIMPWFLSRVMLRLLNAGGSCWALYLRLQGCLVIFFKMISPISRQVKKKHYPVKEQLLYRDARSVCGPEAWLTTTALNTLLQSLNPDYNVFVAALGMGTVALHSQSQPKGCKAVILDWYDRKRRNAVCRSGRFASTLFENERLLLPLNMMSILYWHFIK